MSRTVAALVASIAGLVMVLTAFVQPLGFLGSAVVDWFNVLAAIAFVLGGANLLKMNLMKISAREAGWGYSAVILTDACGGHLESWRTPRCAAPQCRLLW
jgi:hypothetical protein